LFQYFLLSFLVKSEVLFPLCKKRHEEKWKLVFCCRHVTPQTKESIYTAPSLYITDEAYSEM